MFKQLLRSLGVLMLGGASTLSAWPGRNKIQAQLTLNHPMHDLHDALNGQTGYGLGIHWIHVHRAHHVSRTRFDWNVFAQSSPVGVSALKTQVSNYHLAFDHLLFLRDRESGPYLVGGLGAVRWFVQESLPGMEHRFHTTKLGVTGGAGWQFNEHVSIEGRVLVSGIRQAYDSNTAQLALVFRF